MSYDCKTKILKVNILYFSERREDTQDAIRRTRNNNNLWHVLSDQENADIYFGKWDVNVHNIYMVHILAITQKNCFLIMDSALG